MGTSTNVTVLGKIGIQGLVNVNIAVQDTPRDSAQNVARCEVVAARQTFSRQCAGQCRGSRKVRGYQQWYVSAQGQVG